MTSKLELKEDNNSLLTVLRGIDVIPNLQNNVEELIDIINNSSQLGFMQKSGEKTK